MSRKRKTIHQTSPSGADTGVDPSGEQGQTTQPILSEQRQVRRPARMGSVQQQFLHLKGVVNGDVLSLHSAAAARGRERTLTFPSPSDEFRAVLEVGSINYQLFSPQEQEAVIAHYRSLIASLHYPIQILVRVLPVDLEPYLRAIAEQATRRYAQQTQLWKQRDQGATRSQEPFHRQPHANAQSGDIADLPGDSASIEDDPIASGEPHGDGSVRDAGRSEDQPDMALSRLPKSCCVWLRITCATSVRSQRSVACWSVTSTSFFRRLSWITFGALQPEALRRGAGSRAALARNIGVAPWRRPGIGKRSPVSSSTCA